MEGILLKAVEGWRKDGDRFGRPSDRFGKEGSWSGS